MSNVSLLFLLLAVCSQICSFVCAVAKETTGVTRLRSYALPDESNVSATICEAALATSAATGFFDPVTIGARQFVDGALRANNPVEEVEGEAANIWCSDTGDLKPLVKCFISIGTGSPGKKAVEDKMFRLLSKTLVGIVTETENTAVKFADRWAKRLEEMIYCLFNVEQGLQEVGLAEYKEQGRIEAATDGYLRQREQKFKLGRCAQNLQQKQSTYTPKISANRRLKLLMILHRQTWHRICCCHACKTNFNLGLD
jgi:predicted acylesterase/phospholipase RssA